VGRGLLRRWVCTASSLLSIVNIVSAIGLGRSNASVPVYTDTKVPTILSSIVSQGVLDKTIMTLDLPRNTHKIGSIYLGMIPDEVSKSDQIRVPFSHSTSDALVNTWQVRLDNLSVKGSGTTSTEISDLYATLTADMWTSLPKQIYNQTLEALGATNGLYNFGQFVLPTYDCSLWGAMPDLIFTFAGTDIALTEEDYSWRGSFPSGAEHTCAVFLQENEFDSKAVSVGTELLRKFYVVFDMDNDELRREHARYEDDSREVC